MWWLLYLYLVVFVANFCYYFSLCIQVAEYPITGKRLRIFLFALYMSVIWPATYLQYFLGKLGRIFINWSDI